MEIGTRLVQDIKNASHICVLTGAGISAESGVATFRGKEGLWSKFKPQELANMDAFMANPDLVWEWYQHRRDILTTVKPNPGHMALARWEELAPKFTLVTQNVDGLHLMAGSRNVLELHGNIRINRCNRCGSESSMEEITFAGKVPMCPCGGMLRPGVVWFGEMLPPGVFEAAAEASQRCDLFLTIGTSAVVYPAASLPEIALSRGIPVIEVNMEETPLSGSVTYHLLGPAGTILPELVEIFERGRRDSSSGSVAQ
ncbi:NAD-dependent deacylase [bacterium]|nr:NAD-dependent deacylase [bacterium]MBU1984918.1 NAD-dependent deacylase [bacterium]